MWIYYITLAGIALVQGDNRIHMLCILLSEQKARAVPQAIDVL